MVKKQKTDENPPIFSMNQSNYRSDPHSDDDRVTHESAVASAQEPQRPRTQGQGEVGRERQVIRIATTAETNLLPQSTIPMNYSSPLNRRTTQEVNFMDRQDCDETPPVNVDRELYNTSSMMTPPALFKTTPQNSKNQVPSNEEPPPVPQSKPLTLDDTHIEKMTISPLKPSTLLKKNRDKSKIPPPLVDLPFMDADEKDDESGDDFLLYLQDQDFKTNVKESPPPSNIPKAKDESSSSRGSWSTSHSGIEGRSNARSDSESSAPNQLFSIPMDALHSVATFLDIKQWRNFGLVNRDASVACRTVLKKIKMHAFYCAVEVLTTWVSYVSSAVV